VTSPQQTQRAHEAMVQAIMDEIHCLGGWVTSSRPLQDERLRFEVLDDQVPLVLDKLGSWGWSPRPCCAGSRFVPKGNSAELQPTSVYELEMERDKEAPKPHGAEVISSDEYQKLLDGFRKQKQR
jgi:hypothetical protein